MISAIGEMTQSRATEPSDSILLRCVACGADAGCLSAGGANACACAACGFVLCAENGIWRALPPARFRYFSRFIQEYQSIRAAEGRGSHHADYYLSLPYKDLTGRNAGQWKIRARTYTFLVRKILPELKEAAPSPKVLDIGAGNGWMSYRLASAGYCPVAVDLLDNDQDGLGAATHFEKHIIPMFPRLQAEMTCLPFADEQFDAVIFNASFHYAEDYRAAMREALRCTRTGGAVIIADSPWYANRKSGERMVAERQASFIRRYGTASSSIRSLEYLTDEWLSDLAKTFHIRWSIHTPFYGLRWTMRPAIAKLRGRREPSRFRIYIARKTA